MYRKAIEDLKKWKNKSNRKPLVLEGARQVGKTWLMKEFGRQEYDKTAYINCDSNSQIKELFEGDIEIRRIIEGLEIYLGYRIDPDKTLIIFDEIQEVPRALSSLKYFYEEAPQYNIICAGSLLGIALHEGTSFPVGKVEFLHLYPLSFDEFLIASGKESYVRAVEEENFKNVTAFKQTYIESLKLYYYIGGMPEAVATYAEEGDFNEVRSVQKRILEAYEQDFSKHAPENTVPKIRMVWNNIPSQLAKENGKFLYGLLKEGGRAKEFETAIMWLEDCGLIHRICRIDSPKIPMKAYVDLKAFKIFMLDVGLLACMAGLGQKTLLSGNEVFTEFKGALTEQYVMQQLACFDGLNVGYYTNDRNTAEIDFLVDDGEKIVPVEAKAETNLMAKSLKFYREKFSPSLSVRTSMADYKKEEGLINLPLYSLFALRDQIKIK